MNPDPPAAEIRHVAELLTAVLSRSDLSPPPWFQRLANDDYELTDLLKEELEHAFRL